MVTLGPMSREWIVQIVSHDKYLYGLSNKARLFKLLMQGDNWVWSCVNDEIELEHKP